MQQLDETCDAVAATSKKTEKVRLVAEFFHAHPEDAAPVSRAFSAFVSTSSDSYSNEFRMRCKSGEYIWVSCRAKSGGHVRILPPLAFRNLGL